MYPRNSASPPRFAIGAVLQISDGAVQSSGVSVVVRPEGGSETAGGGTVSYGASSNVVYYAPTQAETDYTAFVVTAYKTGCVPVSQTIITTSSTTPGTVLLAPTTHTSAVVPTVSTLTGHTPQTGDSFARLGAPAGASVSADVAAVKAETAAIVADTNELQGDWANGGRLDLILDARASQTSVDTIDGIVDAILVDTAEIGLAGAGLTALASAAALATVDSVVDAILVDTAEIGAAGAGLTAVPWNAAWDAEVQSEVADGLTAYGAATATDVTTAAANVSVDEIQATALADLFNTNSGTTYASAVAGSVVAEIADNAGGSALTASAIADAVWDEALAGHVASGSTGEALNAAGGAGDPWITALPGAYSAGQAGYIVGTYLDAAVSTAGGGLDAAGVRAAVGLASANLDTQLATIDSNVDAVLVDTGTTLPASLATIDGNVDAVLADTNELQTDWANGGRLDLILDARASQTSVDDLPTNAELATALASADDATLAAIAALSIPTATENADALLNRDMSAVSDTNSRSPLNALRFLRNKWALSGTTLTVNKEDDSTSAWTATVTTNASADPITGSDPS